MKIYVIHSTSYDFENELYVPIKRSPFSKKHTFIFPHEKGLKTFNSKEIIKDADLIIAEVSFASTGMGVELGWADTFNKPVLYINKEGLLGSQSLSEVASKMNSYKDTEVLIDILTKQFMHA